MGYDVYSVDIDEESFKAETQFERLDFNDEEACRDFFARHSNEFDMVLGLEVIEHLENPWNYIHDLKKLCSLTWGYILISTPNITSWYSRLNFLLRGRFHQFEDGDRHYGHINPVAIDELLYIAEKEGLEKIEVSPGGWLPRIWLPKGIREKAKNLFGFLLSFIMKGGLKNGWCVIALFRKGI